ncbi:MAG: (2Fe-2S)-binding protein [Chloroflexi bacterium HGW-Chloroflexi-3]|nr:MAG: (2Fe-2S)-binding protein [Chloroflexi bacterium HGW-Chloroflexi-3]
MDLVINNKHISIRAGGGRCLLDFLREDLSLMGTKEGCGEGECGSCTVLLDGKAVLSCMTPMERAIGREVTTIEGVGRPGNLHPLQQAMMEEGGVQCGFCTPGMIMSGVELLNRKSNPNRDEIVEGISGNLCRCTGYRKIITAIERAAEKMS